ncbi:FCD domain-containing protein [Duffyella gerundensis]|uniref:Uxu operon regulator n=1 Tax=Duffyella gerundensis TaxID=1619313 RepID=A0A0U5L3S6_9GAMM|nr:FCD domain-containing protein [Duffyella gerundensis]CUU25102.1 Uxu operon regulator [Duffyella gerundensis]
MPQEKKQYQEIGQHLRQQIIDGMYAVGSRLPTERAIAETWGVSRTIVREALLMLELEGTVDIRQSSGVYVMRIPSATSDEEEAFFRSDVGPFEMLQARQLLESNIAAFAARMATKADIENLRRTLEQEQRAIAMNDSSQDNDKLFHLLLAGATQNQMLLDTVTSVWRHHENNPLWQQLRAHIETRSYRLKWLSEHQTILAALRRRDVMGSWQAMWQHLENVKNTLLEISDANAPDFDGYLFESVPIFQGKLM